MACGYPSRWRRSSVSRRCRPQASGVRSAASSALFVDAFARDYRAADLSPAERAMLDYAVLLTTQPSKVKAADVARLRAAGFDDRAIHDICAIASYYAFVNRIAIGLGVELEPRFE